jgi:hypothetical protein
MLLQQFLVVFVEPDRVEKSDRSSVNDQDGEPDVGEVHVVGLLAVGTSGKGSCRCNPYDDTGRYKLEHAVPGTLQSVR